MVEHAAASVTTRASATASRCVVLGGSGHVGQAVVRRLREAGAEVVFTYDRHADRARELEAATHARGVPWHGGAPLPDIDACWARPDGRGACDDDEHGTRSIDAIVQCIGTAGDPELYRLHDEGYDKFLATSIDEWQSMHDITSTSTFAAVQTLAPRLARPGNVVVVGSIDGVKIVPAPVHYAAAKSALAGMVRALAKALGPRGVCVNMVALGILDGGVGLLLSDTLRKQYIKHCSLARLGRADEVAQIVAFMALHNTYVTGQAIALDGGL
jgi:3-oxoacyl-[acyl-carrier protein] reductase